MAFETEPLILEPVVCRGSALQMPDGTWLHIDDFEPGDLPAGEFQKTLQLFFLTVSQIPNATFEKLLLAMRAQFPSLRLIAVEKVLEFLCDQRLIKNASAYRQVDLLRRQFHWRRSFLAEPLLQFDLAKWPAGHTFRHFTTVGLLPVAAVAAWANAELLTNLRAEVHFDVLSPEMWAAQALLMLALARSTRAILQFFLLRGFTGQSQTLRFELTPVGPTLNTTSLEHVERPTWLEGAATFLALAAIPAPLLVFHSFSPFLAAAFTAIAILIETSPFVGSPLTEVFRYFYTLNDDIRKNREQKAIHWITVATMAWIFAVGYVGMKMFYAFYEPIEDRSVGFFFECAAFLWLPTAILISWLEDLFDGIVFGLQSDRSLIRYRLRLRGHKAKDRPKRRAQEFTDQELWSSLPIVRQLPPELRQRVLASAQLRTFPEGRAICRQGERKRDLFILLSGQAAVIKHRPGERPTSVAMLAENSVFGEAGYFMGVARTADVVAVEECVVLMLACDPNSISTDSTRFSDLQKRIWFLQAMQLNPLFRELPLEAVDALLLQGQMIQFPSGSKIVREGDLADGCFVLIQGKARVLIGHDEVNTSAAGDVIGEVALLTADSHRTATVIANGDVLAVKIGAGPFWQMVSRHFAFGLTLENLALRRLHHGHAAKTRRMA